MRNTLAAYICPFWSRIPEYHRGNGSAVQSDSMKALSSGAWPFDYGDDPAFFAAREFGGPVSWGVCRRDVRRAAQPGDVIQFFSIQEDKRGGPFTYRFCAVLTVAQKIRQTDIWERPEYSQFCSYDNVLIRPDGGGIWQHHESGVPKRDWHSDWLSRLAFRDAQTAEFNDAQDSNSVSADQAARFTDANYVIFSRELSESFICAEPQIVARCDRNGLLEEWVPSPFARKLKEFTVEHTRGSLRTTNVQRAHRHSTWRADAAELRAWRGEFIQWLRKTMKRQAA